MVSHCICNSVEGIDSLALQRFVKLTETSASWCRQGACERARDGTHNAQAFMRIVQQDTFSMASAGCMEEHSWK